MKHIRYLFTSILILAILLASCSSELPADEMFKLVIDSHPTEIQIGEQVTFVARLVNLMDEDFTLAHDIPLISLFVRHVTIDAPENTTAAAISSEIEANGYIERRLSVNPTYAGEFYLRAQTSFMIGRRLFSFYTDDVLLNITG